jgi:transcription elongation GreA/GreB family factor
MFYAIAIDSPIAINLKSKKIGEIISIGNKTQKIIKIV